MIQFNFNENIVLENEFVLLRPLEMSDVDNFLSFSSNEPEIWKYSLLPASGKQNLINYVQDACNARKAEKEYPFIVFDKVQQQYAGCTRFYDIQLAYHAVQLGYTWYGKAFQGTSVNKNCKYLLFEFAFEKWGMERVELRADNRNEKSKAAMKSIGCVVEGVIRKHMPTQEGGRRDSIILSVLVEEWHDTVKENLRNKIDTKFGKQQ